MKNAPQYTKKIRQLVKRMPKSRTVAPDGSDPLRVLLLGILEADASRKQAEQVLTAVQKEFVDLNEMRVSQPRELIECVGRDHPFIREKAEMLHEVLNHVFNRTCRMSLEWLAEVPKRELRTRLKELGLPPFGSAYVAMFAYGVPGVPVDRSLVECLEMDGCVKPGSSAEEVQALLERIVPQRDAQAAYGTLRAYVDKNAKALAKKRQAEAKARAEAQAREAAQEAAEAAPAPKAAPAPAGKARTEKAPSRPARPARAGASRKAKPSPKRTAKHPRRSGPDRPDKGRRK